MIKLISVGHVDHGKSTIFGRLLQEMGAIPPQKVEQLKRYCSDHGKRFEYAFLFDALKNEQEQGITIDIARIPFSYRNKKFLLLDAPGHTEFMKNMITGATQADAAFLVIDAQEGIKENSKRHGYFLSLLGITQITILINKMDLVGYKKETYEALVSSYKNTLKSLNLNPLAFIPMSGYEGDNLLTISKNTPWYSGPTLIEVIDKLNTPAGRSQMPFRMPIQDVYKFSSQENMKRILAGTIASGKIKLGDRVVFFPSRSVSRIKSLECFGEDLKEASSGKAIGLTLEDPLFNKRGELISIEGETPPAISQTLKVKVFWLGASSLQKNKKYFLKIHTAKVSFEIKEILSIFDPSSLSNKEEDVIEKNHAAECIFRLQQPISFDEMTEFSETNRFVIIDDYRIEGGGIILADLQEV